jgi:hypothetical protein
MFLIVLYQVILLARAGPSADDMHSTLIEHSQDSGILPWLWYMQLKAILRYQCQS